MRPSPRLLLPLLALAACTAPPAWDREVRIPLAANLSTSARTLEVSLEARAAPVVLREGAPPIELYTYNGRVPGPTLRARAGDRVRVHFTNHLTEPTTIHWHGVRLPIAMDGVPDEPTPPVAPGATFDYDFIAPDPGTYWYHPHVRSSAQVSAGLYGALIVDPAATSATPGADTEPPDLGDELTIVLSDVDIDATNHLAPADVGGEGAALFGREGNVVLFNGHALPRFDARRGRRQRWRIINAARARYFQLELGTQRLVRIGGDSGLRAAPLPPADRILVVPGERAEVLWTPDAAPGTVLSLFAVPYNRGYFSALSPDPRLVAQVQISNESPETAPGLPTSLRTITALDPAAVTATQTITLTQDTSTGHPFFAINGHTWPQGVHLAARLGETQRWRVVNQTPGSHPFHLHGFRFQVTDAGAATSALAGEWKDTLEIPSNSARELLVRFDDRPGAWMFHCHILDHAELGMMGMVDVGP